MSNLTIKQKKEWAQTLYVVERLSQKEIAKKVGVSEKTMSQWANKEKWDTLRVSVIISKEQQLNRLYAQINELNTAIEKRAEGERYAIKGEADTLVKLTSAAKDLEMQTGISETITVLKNLTNWVKVFDLPKAQDLVKLHDQFIQAIIK